MDRERVNLGLLAVGVLLFMLFAWSFYQDIARQSAMGRPGAVEEFADTRF